MYVIELYKVILCLCEFKELEELLMEEFDKNLEKVCIRLLREKKKVNFEMFEEE